LREGLHSKNRDPRSFELRFRIEEGVMTLEIEGLVGRPSLRAVIRRKMTEMFESSRARATAVRVGFVDENGPKGGIGVTCRITVEVPRRPTGHVEHRAESERMAFDGALEALERQISSDRGRRLDARRRPRKYYLAKRLLMPAEGETSVKERGSERAAS
jgi:sigma 54 modulation/S30EA-like ribosomal protein